MLFDVFLCSARQTDYESFVAEKDVALKAEIALDLWNYYLSNNLDSLKVIGTELLHDASELGDDFGKAVAYRIIGDYEIWNGIHNKGREHLLGAARHFLSMENYLLYSECLISLGNSYFMEGDIDDAERAFLYALDAGKKSGDQSAWFAAELNLAKLHAAKGDTVKAINLGMHFKNEALRLSRFEATSNAYGFLYNMTTNDSLLRSEYLQKSIEFARKSRALNQLSHALNNAAIEQFYNSRVDSAEVLFKEALILRRNANNHRLICEGLQNLAQLYFAMGESEKARDYIDSMITHALSTRQRLAVKEGFAFRCQNLQIEGDCERLAQLQMELDSLGAQDAQLLDEIISIYQVAEQQDEGNDSNIWLAGLLAGAVLLGLGWLIYKD
ncbi:MAG: tetratricopeptide repeat protein [Crocinitomicaceae bacterium]